MDEFVSHLQPMGLSLVVIGVVFACFYGLRARRLRNTPRLYQDIARIVAILACFMPAGAAVWVSLLRLLLSGLLVGPEAVNSEAYAWRLLGGALWATGVAAVHLLCLTVALRGRE